MTGRYRIIIAALSAVIIVLAAFLITRVTQAGPDIAAPTIRSSPAPTITTGLPPAIPGPNPTTSTPGGPGESHTNDQAEDPDVDNEQAWKPVVTNFGRNFTNTVGGNRAWRNRLIVDPANAYVTTAVAKQLATVEIDNVPAGHYDSYQPVKTTTLDVAVKVDYTEGWSMILYLNTDGTHWQIYAYDRYVE